MDFEDRSAFSPQTGDGRNRPQTGDRRQETWGRGIYPITRFDLPTTFYQLRSTSF